MNDEIKECLGLTVELYDIETVTRSPEKVDGALVLSLPYHVEHLRQIFPSATCETVTLEVSAEDTASALKLPAGAIVLVVAHSQTILPFASVFLKSLRGDEILVEARHISEAQAWKRLCRAADMVYADVCAAPLVARAHPRQLRELRLINASALARLRDALFFVVPKIAPATAEAR
ncbi:MAG: hypothetical protein MUF51_10115 [Vicinamibacteria bacterium]|nr:hypothetical protein [Vicinamibacteria bacterium]